MRPTRRNLIGGVLSGIAAAATVLPARRAVRAQTRAPALRIGVLTDLSGPYSDTAGRGAVAATQLAAEEAQAAHQGLVVEVLQADHLNKPDVGAGIARQWFDRDGVDVVVDVPNSTVGLAVAEVAREKDKVFLVCGAGTTDLTGPRCAPTTVHWTFDTYMLARSNGGALVKAGRKSWFFLTANYAFGQALQKDATAFIEQAGGSVVGSVSYPFPQTTDFSSFLLQAQSSNAEVLALANAGADTINCIKQAAEFGLIGSGGMNPRRDADVHPRRARSRASGGTRFGVDRDVLLGSERPDPRLHQARGAEDGSGLAAGHGARRVLRGHAALSQGRGRYGPAEAKRSGSATVARMKAMPTDDDAFGPGRIREDGRKLHPAYLFQVKAPDESKGPWDYYKLLATTPADEVARPLKEGGCPLVKA